MIKIKDYIFNENEIEYIKKELEGIIVCPKAVNVELKAIENATFEDIEWNYGSPQETQKKMQKELCKSCYYRDTISNKLEELEEENFDLKEKVDSYNILVSGYKKIEEEKEKKLECITNLLRDNANLELKINKAIEYIEHEQFKRIILGFGRDKYLDAIKNKTIEILKGEE